MHNDPRPRSCRPEAYDAFAREVRDLDRPDALVRAAVALSLHERPSTDPGRILGRIESLAARVRARVHVPNDDSRLAHLHAVLFDEERLRGDTRDFDAPRNSYLGDVMQRRRGLPITLTLVYREVGRRVGLDVRGVSAPGHFLAAVESDSGRLLVDPFFGGRVVALDEALERAGRVTGLGAAAGPDLLPEATPWQWLTRMVRNLQASFARRQRPADADAMAELLGLLEQHVP